MAHHISHPTKSPVISCSLLTLQFWQRKVRLRGSRHSAVRPVLNLFVIAVTVCQLYSKYLILVKILNNIFTSWLCPEFCSWDMNIYSVLSTFPSCPNSFLRTNNPSVFPYNYTLQFNSPLLISTSSIELKCISTVITQTLPLCLRLPSSISQACFWITLQSADYTKRLYLNHLHKTELFQCCTHFTASHSTGSAAYCVCAIVTWNSSK